jgi:hypothetical protein
MRYRPFLFAIPWVLVLIVAPEVLGEVYSLRLRPTEARLWVLDISMTIIYSAPALGMALAVIGLVKRAPPMAIHGVVTCLLSLGILVCADSIPPKRFYGVDSICRPSGHRAWYECMPPVTEA